MVAEKFCRVLPLTYWGIENQFPIEICKNLCILSVNVPHLSILGTQPPIFEAEIFRGWSQDIHIALLIAEKFCRVLRYCLQKCKYTSTLIHTTLGRQTSRFEIMRQFWGQICGPKGRKFCPLLFFVEFYHKKC